MNPSIAIAFLALCSVAQAYTPWSYSNTNWGSVNDTATCGNSTHGFCTICDESNQSPINIVTSTASDADYSDFSFSLGYQVVQEGTIKSNGHTIKFSVDESFGASISGGPLGDTYTLNQFHLHWGSEQGQGSEHTVDGESFDAELHLVHYKSSYSSINAAIAADQPDSLAVVGILIKEIDQWDQSVGVRDSNSINNLRESVWKLRNGQSDNYGQGDSISMEVVLEEFVSAISDLRGFYHYEGSLTTPACNEIVQWIVMEQPLYVRRNHLMHALRSVTDYYGYTFNNNYRPTQSVGSRTVYHYSA